MTWVGVRSEAGCLIGFSSGAVETHGRQPVIDKQW